MKRLVEPELLDDLPHDDPHAVASRRDIARINRLMGNGQILLNALRAGSPEQTPERIVELGAGDGSFMLELAGRLSPEWREVELVLVDQRSVVSAKTRAAFGRLGWRLDVAVADVFDWLEKSSARTDIILANLFLHHFQEKDLARLLSLAAARCDLFAACEPRRGMLPQLFSRMTGFIGCNAVTRHDAVASVRAGFAGKELCALWPSNMEWRLRECNVGLFSHHFSARRIAAPSA